MVVALQGFINVRKFKTTLNNLRFDSSWDEVNHFRTQKGTVKKNNAKDYFAKYRNYKQQNIKLL